MFEQLLDGLRKASEASMSEDNRALQKRWVQTATESMTKQRELLDAACRSGIQLVEQAGQVADAKSTEDFRHQIEELWRKTFEIMKTQSEAQLEQLMKASQAFLQPPQGR